FGCLAGGGALGGHRLLASDTIAAMTQEQVRAVDPLVGHQMVLGLGFQLQSDRRQFGPPASAFGHPGAGGSVHGAWPAQGIGFSYTMNQMRDAEDARASSLLVALHGCV